MPLPRLVIAGIASGAGKTTVATGLMAALTRKGVRVQAYKAGPDYIDPGFHRLATGRPSRNLDPWILGAERVTALFHRAARPADLAVIEGVMGLFDGRDAGDDAGGTAHLARLLAAPVVLVVDASGMGRSVAAIVQGFRDFDPRVRVAGVILNRVGSEGHARLLREAVAPLGLPVLGAIPRDDAVGMPERHLGLVPAGEAGGDVIDRLGELVARWVDLDAVTALARSAPPLAGCAASPVPVPPAPGKNVRLGLAMDKAFHFYYQDALDLLEALGAELVPFSPLADSGLPENLDGLYLGGGYPEVFAAELAANGSLRREIRDAAEAGMPVYAECGGLMYLCRSLADLEGRDHAMAGVVPARAVMGKRLAGFGYKEAEAPRETLLLAAGERVRGHEFHYGFLEWDQAPPAGWLHAYHLRRKPGEAGTPEGWARGNVLASFLHLHFHARPAMAQRLVAHCAAFRAARESTRKGEEMCK